MIWKQAASLEYLNALCRNTLGEALGMVVTAIGDDYIEATMPVDARTVQPVRILHGGASVALAETLGSVASVLCLPDVQKYSAVGVEINANHLKSVREGSHVVGRVSPIRIGRTMHVWNIEIRNPRGQLVCVSRLTCAIVQRGGQAED